MAQSIEELQSRIGYRFQNTDYLTLAVTHSSFANETGAQNHHLLSNERLEFLGDTVLSLIAAQYLYGCYPGAPEGTLSKRLSSLKSEESYSGFAEELQLGDYLRLGKGEEKNGGAQKPAILADAFEALAAAVYLDAGANGLAAVASYFLPLLEKNDKRLMEDETDPKSRLQEFLQKDRPVQPKYEVIGENGPDHAKVFEVAVYLDSNCLGRGSGTSRQKAEQEAAADALRLFGVTR